MDYSTLTKTQLQDEIDRRNGDGRGADLHIPRTGNNPELIDRLVLDDRRLAADDDDLLADEEQEPAQEPEPEVDEPTEEGPGEGDDGKSDPPMQGFSPPAPVHQKTFEARYPFEGSELSTGLHLDNLARIVRDAEAAGHRVKGGASRIRVEVEGGRRFAVYQVMLRRG